MTREEQLDWLCRLRSGIYVYMPKEWLIPMNNALDMSIKALEQEPKTGHWISREGKGQVLPFWGRYECSECSECAENSNYCPNCGARMEREDKECTKKK